MGRFDDDNQESKGYVIAMTGLKAVIRILLLVLVALFVIAAARKVYHIGYEAFSTKAVSKDADDAIKATVSITRDMSVSDIANKLNELGLIKMSEEAFRIEAAAYGYKDFIPGHYQLNSSMSPDEMMEIMTTKVEEDDS